MKICYDHRVEIERSVPEKYWMRTAQLLAERLVYEVDMARFQNNLKLLYESVEIEGGCPVCFAGDVLMKVVLTTVGGEVKFGV